MRYLRALIFTGVAVTATVGSSLVGELLRMPEHAANGQTMMMSRAPSTLAPVSVPASAGSYHSVTPYTPPRAVRAIPSGYNTDPITWDGTGYPHTAPTLPVQPKWSAQASHRATGVMSGHTEILDGLRQASPQVQLSPPTSSRPAPNYHWPTGSTQAHSMLAYPYAPAGWKNPATYDDCEPIDVSKCAPPAARHWFGSVSGLLMTRDHGDHYTFSYGTGNEADQRTDTRDADMQWEYGFDTRIGRYFNCQRNAIEVVYWSLYPDSQSTQTVSADVVGQLNGILNWSSLDYGGASADNYVNVGFGDDGVHMLTRDYSFQNIELNLWRFCGSCTAAKCDCTRFRHDWLVGMRYFRFGERLLFASDADDTQITFADDEIFYDIDIENHLIGVQVGSEAEYAVYDRLTADLGIKLGVYSNQVDHVSEIRGNLGTATINNGPFLGQAFYVESTKDDVAFLGEVNLALRYRFPHRWTGTVGYRALAVTGVAMPADQIYPDVRGINDVENIDSSRALILHGGYLGVEYNW